MFEADILGGSWKDSLKNDNEWSSNKDDEKKYVQEGADTSFLLSFTW